MPDKCLNRFCFVKKKKKKEKKAIKCGCKAEQKLAASLMLQLPELWQLCLSENIKSQKLFLVR